MKVVIADTSPLNYLILVDAVEILPCLYGRVTIPDAVLGELTNEDAPKKVAEWAAMAPEWLDVQPAPLSEDPSLEALDAGERAAILLAQRQTEVLLLIDDAFGRAEAAKRGIPTIGTLGVLRAASLQGLIALPAVLARLMDTNFRYPRLWWMSSLRNTSRGPGWPTTAEKRRTLGAGSGMSTPARAARSRLAAVAAAPGIRPAAQR